MCDVGVIVGADPAQVNGIGNLIGRLAHIVLANANRGIFAAGAARHVKLMPADPVVCRTTNAVGSKRRSGSAGGIRHIRGALGRDLDVTMNTAAAYGWVKQWNAWTKCHATVVTGCAFG